MRRFARGLVWLAAIGSSLSLNSFARAEQATRSSTASGSVTWHARGATAARSDSQTLPDTSSRSVQQAGKQSLAWRAAGAKIATPPQSSNKPVAEPLPAKSRVVTADFDGPEIEQVANHQPARLAEPRARRMPAPSARSKTRDAVMQVSTDMADTVRESSDRLRGGRDEDQAPSLDPPEASPSSKTTSEPSPLGDGSDPFPDEKVPQPLGADEPSTSDLPPLNEPQEPVEAPREPLTDPQDALDRQEPSMNEPDPTMPDVEVPMTPDTDTSCAKEKEDCEKAIENLRGRDIRKIIVGIQIEGEGDKPAIEGRDYPCECALGLRTTFQGRHWAPVTFTWKASAQCHKPLYFEDVQLERYGHSWNPVVQPFMSAGHFFVSVPLLPYKMGLTPPCECMYTLGYYRPGDCAPYMIEPIPLSLRAGAFQALGATGFAFWFWPPVTGPAALVGLQQ